MTLTDEQRRELQRRVKSRKGRADDARRARCILMLEQGHTWAQIREALGCSDSFIASWSKRFDEQGLSGLYSRHRGQPPSKLTPKLEAKILNATRRKPTDGSTHWSTRRLANKLGISHMMVASFGGVVMDLGLGAEEALVAARYTIAGGHRIAIAVAAPIA